jgi:hypothetical protein
MEHYSFAALFLTHQGREGGVVAAADTHTLGPALLLLRVRRAVIAG